MKSARATPHYCAFILWKTRRNSSDMDMPFPPLVLDYCVHTSRSESLSAASALRRYGVDTSAGRWISDCEPSGEFPVFPVFPAVVFAVESVGLLTLLAFWRRRHDAHSPRAECRRLRTIDEADHGANPSAGAAEETIPRT